MFKRVPATLMSTSRRLPIYGHGINNADYVTNAQVDGVKVICPLYNQWKAMLQRCYCLKWQERYPTYQGCSVVPEWLYYSRFMEWAETQDWQDKNLDKDLLVPGNKVYGPDTCIWVPGSINRLLLNSVKRRGIYPVGVSLLDGKYIARLSVEGAATTLGLYDTPELASEAFLRAKATHVRNIASRLSNLKLSAALFRIATLIETGQYYA